MRDRCCRLFHTAGHITQDFTDMTDHSDPSRADAILRRLRSEKGIIAMVGASAKPERAFYQVMAFMQKAGIRVIPVNPGMTGETLLGETVVARLADITLPVWMVDVFRPAEACPPIAEEAIAIGATCLWLQEGVISDEAAALASGAGIEVVMDLCPKKLIEAANTSG